MVRNVALVSLVALLLVGCAGQHASRMSWTVQPALNRADAAIAAIVKIPADQRNFDNTLGALDDMLAQIDADTGMLVFMQNVSTSAEERDKSQEAEKEIKKWMIDLNKREDLYKAVKQYADTKPTLVGEQKRLLEFTLRDFRRAGMELTPQKRDELKAIQNQTVDLEQKFDQRYREDKSFILVDASELANMKDDYRATLKKADDPKLPAEIRSKIDPKDSNKLVITMDSPTYDPLLDLCDNEALRKRAWIAYKSRCAPDNIPTLEQVLKLRAQAAQILGYPNAADYEIEPRMAKNSATVKAFFDKLRPIVRKKSQLDYAELLAEKVAVTKSSDTKLYPWDQQYYKNRLMKGKYAVDGEKMREYFPMERVIDGLFKTTQSLYGLEYREVTADAEKKYGTPLWHPDVRVYDVYDKSTNKYLGVFYIDLFPRENKFSHAAQWGIRQHKIYADGRLQTPMACLVCNFTKPTKDKPSLLSHHEVETFFHEFGHCLHTILSECHYTTFSGTNVAMDFVEAPSQMFENWTWDANVLNTFAQHYQTGEKLPKTLLDGMAKARTLASGLEAEHQIFYALTALTFHSAPDGIVDTTAMQAKLFKDIELYEPVPGTAFHASFGHLIGYGCAYYSYMWSLVYAQDVFSRFRELGITSPQAGQIYRKKILARGSSVDEFDLLRDFLGREPKLDAFLEHLGLSTEKK